jgi:hypothetical protein
MKVNFGVPMRHTKTNNSHSRVKIQKKTFANFSDFHSFIIQL